VNLDQRAELKLAPADPGGRSLTSLAYTGIKEAIMNGSLPPGSLTSVPALSEALGVSRSPVREALVDLVSEGLVRFERNRGVRVVEQNQHDIEEIFDLRLLLEVPATRRALQFLGNRKKDELITQLQEELTAMHEHIDDEVAFMEHDATFHRILLDQSGNRRLSAFVTELRDQTRSLGISTVGRSRSLPDVLHEHQAILAAIQAGDAEAAASQMETHVRHTRDLLIGQILRRADADGGEVKTGDSK
jgi:DNA-binding GntR family transcriptional regulator